MAQGSCPDCDSPVKVGDRPRKGQLVTCSTCGAYLQVSGLSPIELDWAYDVDDSDDDFYEDEDD
jgi:lysine biosynthesis protein LysW